MDKVRQDDDMTQTRSVRQIMETTYKNKDWGDEKHDFYSGQGSHLPKIVDPYVLKIRQFLNAFKAKLRVSDLGCGDFNVASRLVDASAHYIGVDIVPELIARNKALFRHPNLEFGCLNIIEDALPTADCVLVRQVFQHLSNEQIAAVANKLNTFKYFIVTEHVPKGDFVPNIDKETDAYIRLAKNSGVVLTAPPFSFKPLKQRELIQVHLKKGQIVTTLYQNF